MIVLKSLIHCSAYTYINKTVLSLYNESNREKLEWTPAILQWSSEEKAVRFTGLGLQVTVVYWRDQRWGNSTLIQNVTSWYSGYTMTQITLKPAANLSVVALVSMWCLNDHRRPTPDDWFQSGLRAMPQSLTCPWFLLCDGMFTAQKMV